jgi:hypothetical protein
MFPFSRVVYAVRMYEPEFGEEVKFMATWGIWLLIYWQEGVEVHIPNSRVDTGRRQTYVGRMDVRGEG